MGSLAQALAQASRCCAAVRGARTQAAALLVLFQVSPPYPGLGTVQLVPCLCPISKDPDSVKPMQSMQTMQGMPGLAPASVQAMQTMSSVQAMPPVQHQASAAQPTQQQQQPQ